MLFFFSKAYFYHILLTTSNYFCVDSPNYLCHFWNQSHFSQHKSSLSFYLKHYILSTKAQIFRLSTAQLKVHQNSPCHFSIKKSVFLNSLDLFSVSWEIILLYFLVWNFMCYGKSSTSKCKFPDLLLLALKFTKFLMSILEPRVSFSSNFTSLFSLMRHNSSVLFHLKICILWTNGSNQSAYFWTFNCSHKN